jgi:hypothetical protein
MTFSPAGRGLAFPKQEFQALARLCLKIGRIIHTLELIVVIPSLGKIDAVRPSGTWVFFAEIV